MLGYIRRVAEKFDNPLALCTLYTALVRSHLEYASVIWAPHTRTYCLLIERVQHKFLRFAAFRLGRPMGPLDHDYTAISLLLNMQSLECRRCMADLVFLYSILNNLFDVPALSSLIVFRPEGRVTRTPEIFVIPHYRANYGFHSWLTRILRLGNRYAGELTLFGGSLSRFRSSLIPVLSMENIT